VPPTTLITGGAGYLGSVLTRQLLDDGHEVIIYDKFLFGRESIPEVDGDNQLSVVEGDIHDTARLRELVADARNVVHMASIVGEPACSADIDQTIRTNLNATVQLKELVADTDVEHFVFMSTCSVYGDSNEEPLTEVSKTRPISSYSQTKRLAEESLLEDAEETSATVLRLATVHGLSPRPRFDLSVNYLTKEAVLNGAGTIYGGDQWRPFIHTTDVARGIRHVLDADRDVVTGEIYNVGSDDENYQMKEVGRMLDDLVPGATIEVDASMVDERSYRGEFTKIANQLSYEPRMTVEDGIEEIRDAVRDGVVEDPNDRRYYNYQPKEE